MPLGTTELLIILGIIVFFFGASRLPGLARSLGDAMGEFRKATKESTEEQNDASSRSDSASSDEV